MINEKLMYTLDDVVLSKLCVNTNSVIGNERLIKFKEYLNTIHNLSELYENSIEEYSMFIINSILLNSLETNKNILQYEQYFYEVLTGFSKSKSFKITPSMIASIWINLVNIYEQLISFTSDPKVLEVTLFKRMISKTRFINTSPVNVNYYWDIPISIKHVDNSVRNILIIPVSSSQNILSNFSVLSTINSHSNAQHLSIIKLFKDNLDIQLFNLDLNSNLFKWVKNYMNTYYIDFSSASISLCSFCPLSCNNDFLFKLTYPNTTQRKLKIKHLN